MQWHKPSDRTLQGPADHQHTDRSDPAARDPDGDACPQRRQRDHGRGGQDGNAQNGEYDAGVTLALSWEY